MKTAIRLLLAAAVCATAATTHAQSPAPSTPPSSGEAAKPEGGKWGGRFERMTDGMTKGLPEDVRNRFREIRDEALQDPEIAKLRAKAEAAGKEFRDAMRAAVEERDPELAKTVREHFEKRWNRNGQRGPDAKKTESGASAPTPIPQDKRDRLERAREIARQAPAVQTARAKMQAAQTPEAKEEARGEYREAMRAAMLTADPSIIDVIESAPRKGAGGSDGERP